MTESLEIDPFDSDRMLYGTGATIYGGTNLTAWDTGGKVAIRPSWRRASRRPPSSTWSARRPGAPLISGAR